VELLGYIRRRASSVVTSDRRENNEKAQGSEAARCTQGASSRWQAQEKNNTPVVRSEDRNNSEPQKSATNLSQSPLEMRFEKFGSPSGIIHRQPRAITNQVPPNRVALISPLMSQCNYRAAGGREWL
jgi:hypothetical protein